MRSRAALLCLAVLVAACGKGAKGECPQLDICGNDPSSDKPWQVSQVCQVPVVRPSQPGDVNDFQQMTPPLAPTVAPPQPNPVVAQQTTSGDWCSSLVLTQDPMGYHVTNANLWHEVPAVSQDAAKPSTILLVTDKNTGQKSYLTKLFFEDDSATHFAPRCLVANGAVGATCGNLGDALTTFYKMAANPAVAPTFTNISCTDSTADGGCDCTYKFNLEVDDSGTWQVDPNDRTVLVQDSTVLQFNGTTMNAAAPTTTLRSSFCAQNGTLQLSGLRGGSLSNVQGLRTLELAPQ
jgi:hypothetical protein